MSNSQTLSERFRQGFAITNRYWQLVVIHVGLAVVNLIALLAFVVLPMVVLAASVGLDAQRSGDIAAVLESFFSGAALTQSLAALTVALLGVAAFITLALVLWLLVTGGTLASLAQATRMRGSNFSMAIFIGGAKKLFMPLGWYYTIISVIMLALAAALSMAVAVGVTAYGAMGLKGTTLGIFLGSMGGLMLGACGLFFILCIYLITMQGLAPLAFGGHKAWAAIKEGFDFLDRDRQSLSVLLASVGGYVIVQVFLALAGGIIQLIPLLGIIIYMPYSIAANILGIYLFVALLAIVLLQYAHANDIIQDSGIEMEEKQEEEDSSAAGSSRLSDTSWQEEPLSALPPEWPDDLKPPQDQRPL